MFKLALTGVVQFVGHRTKKRNVAGSVPGQGTGLGCWPGPCQDAHARGNLSMSLSHVDVSLPSFPFL